MARSKVRQIALDICLEQLENAHYTLERDEYKDLTREENIAVQAEMYKMLIAFRKYYDLPV